LPSVRIVAAKPTRNERLRLSRLAFRMISRPSSVSALDNERSLEARTKAVQQFLGRIEPALALEGARVLDVGSGYGALCFHLAENGAARVVGMEVNPPLVEFTRTLLTGRYSHLADRVEFRLVADIDDLEEYDFDLIITQDVLIYIQDLERFVAALAKRLKPGGRLAIGMSPLWYSPWGGLIKHTTWLPWAHLVFPEELFAERGHTFFGDSHMTLRRFLSVMRNSDLEEQYLAFNVVSRSGLLATVVLAAARALRTLPGVRELLTFSVYGSWRKPN
jgi:2-polyprenyl-3-methyl-5-hydroxy-6-metoxy-1,4-benzoquinol methylase